MVKNAVGNLLNKPPWLKINNLIVSYNTNKFMERTVQNSHRRLGKKDMIPYTRYSKDFMHMYKAVFTLLYQEIFKCFLTFFGESTTMCSPRLSIPKSFFACIFFECSCRRNFLWSRIGPTRFSTFEYLNNTIDKVKFGMFN
jgi:hypothetical protein